MKNLKLFGLIASLGIFAVVAFGLIAYLSNQQGAQSYETGRITGRVFFDKNADEQCDVCECGIETVKIRLYEETCQGLFLQTVYSDSEGYFAFEGLEPDMYCVLSDLSPTCDGYLPTTDTTKIIELGAGEDIELEWFGYDSFIDVNE